MDNLERAGRVELAAAFRMAARLGLHEGVCNHFSLALVDDGSEFLLNPLGRHFGELRARDLLRVAGDGRVIAGDGEVEASALHIHGRLHRTRPDARCILHTHMPYATALTSIAAGGSSPSIRTRCAFTAGSPTTTSMAASPWMPTRASGSRAPPATGGSCSSPITAS